MNELFYKTRKRVNLPKWRDPRAHSSRTTASSRRFSVNNPKSILFLNHLPLKRQSLLKSPLAYFKYIYNVLILKLSCRKINELFFLTCQYVGYVCCLYLGVDRKETKCKPKGFRITNFMNWGGGGYTWSPCAEYTHTGEPLFPRNSLHNPNPSVPPTPTP